MERLKRKVLMIWNVKRTVRMKVSRRKTGRSSMRRTRRGRRQQKGPKGMGTLRVNSPGKRKDLEREWNRIRKSVERSEF